VTKFWPRTSEEQAEDPNVATRHQVKALAAVLELDGLE